MKALFLAGLLALAATLALAHSNLETTEPENGAVLSDVPTHIVLSFATSIRLTRVRMIHDGTGEVDLDLGGMTAFATHFMVPLADRGGGHYQIEWRGLSEDGHVMRNAFTFEVQ